MDNLSLALTIIFGIFGILGSTYMIIVYFNDKSKQKLKQRIDDLSEKMFVDDNIKIINALTASKSSLKNLYYLRILYFRAIKTLPKTFSYDGEVFISPKFHYRQECIVTETNSDNNLNIHLSKFYYKESQFSSDYKNKKPMLIEVKYMFDTKKIIFSEPFSQIHKWPDRGIDDFKQEHCFIKISNEEKLDDIQKNFGLILPPPVNNHFLKINIKKQKTLNKIQKKEPSDNFKLILRPYIFFRPKQKYLQEISFRKIEQIFISDIALHEFIWIQKPNKWNFFAKKLCNRTIKYFKIHGKILKYS